MRFWLDTAPSVLQALFRFQMRTPNTIFLHKCVVVNGRTIEVSGNWILDIRIPFCYKVYQEVSIYLDVSFLVLEVDEIVDIIHNWYDILQETVMDMLFLTYPIYSLSRVEHLRKL